MKTRGPGDKGQNLAESKNIIHMVKLDREHKTFYCAYFLDKRMEGVINVASYLANKSRMHDFVCGSPTPRWPAKGSDRSRVVCRNK
jgi:hypothetical protein